LRSGLRAIVAEFRPSLRLTPMQDVLLCDLSSSILPRLEARLDEYGIPRPDRISPSRRHSMSCPAIPTCALAISESERALPGIIDDLEKCLAELGLSEEAIGVRMTGCPNGCARPYQSDIGIVGRSGNKYVLYVGGRAAGDHLNFELRDLTPREEIVTTLRPLLMRFREERQNGEGFGDFCRRLGPDVARAMVGNDAARHES
jgi:sulfite reductase (ferredoxin)